VRLSNELNSLPGDYIDSCDCDVTSSITAHTFSAMCHNKQPRAPRGRGFPFYQRSTPPGQIRIELQQILAVTTHCGNRLQRFRRMFEKQAAGMDMWFASAKA